MSLGQGLEDSAISQAIKVAGWIIPLLQSIHIVTIGVVFVSSLMIALRVFGRMRADEPFPVVWKRFAPWMWIGLVVMVITGVFLVLGEPVREFTALSFWLKMTLLAVAVIITAIFGRTFGPAAASRAAGSAAQAAGAYAPTRDEFSPGAKAVAGGIMVIWLAIIFLGRAIAYDVEVWGSLSLHGT
ncbi:MAG: DUF6644 family protein [Gammaproteobacteria bacterium]